LAVGERCGEGARTPTLDCSGVAVTALRVGREAIVPRLGRIVPNEMEQMMLVRTALGLLSASAMVAGTVPPAMAGGGDGELWVRVFKEVDDGDHEFRIRLWTDEESRRVFLEDGECARVRLDFSDNRLRVREFVDEDDWDVRFRVRGDVEGTREDSTSVRIRFDDERDEPRLRIRVINEEA